MTLKVVELFAGIGAQAEALKNSGIDHEIVAISEIDKNAIKAYEAIHGKVNNLGDICKIEHLPDCDLITNSSPCQDISISGDKQGMSEGSGTRSALIWEVIRLLKDAKERDKLPKYILTENVKAITFKKNRPDLDKYIEMLSDLGYTTTWKIMKASDYGIPQARERCFMVSSLDGREFVFPEPTELQHKLKDFLETDADKKYYLSDKMIETYEEHRKRQEENGRGFGWHPRDPKVDDIINTITTRPMRCASGNYIIVTGNLNIKGRHESSLRVYDPDGLCPTLQTYQGGGLVPKMKMSDDPLKIRVLTPRECMRLQGFTDKDVDAMYSTGLSNSAIYKAAGNSIAVNCLESIFKGMFKDDSFRKGSRQTTLEG